MSWSALHPCPPAQVSPSLSPPPPLQAANGSGAFSDYSSSVPSTPSISQRELRIETIAASNTPTPIRKQSKRRSNIFTVSTGARGAAPEGREGELGYCDGLNGTVWGCVWGICRRLAARAALPGSLPEPGCWVLLQMFGRGWVGGARVQATPSGGQLWVLARMVRCFGKEKDQRQSAESLRRCH